MKTKEEKELRHQELCEIIKEFIGDKGMSSWHPVTLQDVLHRFSGPYKEKHLRKAWKAIV
jgi:hypothetical protein